MVQLREHIESHDELLRTVSDDIRRQIWTALPGKVVEDSDGKTVKVQPTIKGLTHGEGGVRKYVDMPQHEARIHFTRGGGFALTHPIKSGDTGLIIYCSRNIDDWVDQGGNREPLDERMHSMSDCIFLPGISDQTRDLKNVSTTSVQLRSEDETGGKPRHYFEVDAQNGRVTTSIDGGRHVMSLDKTLGLSFTSEATLNINARNVRTTGHWIHDGQLRTTGIIQSNLGLKAPLVYGVAGPVADVITEAV
jgi:hypothetical protein